MTYEEYQERVLARASHRWYNNKLDFPTFVDVLVDFIHAGNRLDRVKKALMYGRDYNEIGRKPQAIELSLFDPGERNQNIIHAMLGAATEGVEMMEALLAFATDFNSDPKNVKFDIVNLQEEFGDIEWYRAFFLRTVGQTNEQNLKQNDAKLEKRFGPGQVFSEHAANNRDLETERKILEGNIDG